MRRVGLQRVSLPLREAPRLEAGQVHVWLARPTGLPMPGVVPAGEFGDDSTDRATRGAAGYPVGNEEENRATRVRRERIAQKFLLRLLLGAYLDCPGRDVRLVRGRHGKPELAEELAGRDLHFNLSHAGGWLAIAVARRIEV
ncbi:MAG: 4'-phosphopantetheinyl transferase family protein, partial [Wenzhouxiangellaceae bacterium]